MAVNIPIKGIIKHYEMMLTAENLSESQREFYNNQLKIYKDILKRSEKDD